MSLGRFPLVAIIKIFVLACIGMYWYVFLYTNKYIRLHHHDDSSTFNTYNTYRYMPYIPYMPIRTTIHAYTIKYISLHINSYNTYHTYQYMLYVQIHYEYIQIPYVPIRTNTCNTYHCQYVHQYVPSCNIPIHTKIHAKIYTHTYQYVFTDSIRANTSIAHP